MLWRVPSKSRIKISGSNSQNSAQRYKYLKVSLTWVEMVRYVYSNVQEENSAAILVQVQYIYSHKLPSRKDSTRGQALRCYSNMSTVVQGAQQRFCTRTGARGGS